MATDWPEGLSDEDAIERLQSVLLQACEGNKDLSLGREYKALRRTLLSREDLADVVPSFIRSQRDLAYFWSFIKAHDPQWEPRRQFIRETFTPLFDRVEGRTKPSVRAAKWTGRRSPSEQAAVVISLGYDTLAGIDFLLDEQERGLHNGGPVDHDKADAIAKLKALHHEVGELIRLAEAEQPISERLGAVQALARQALHWTSSPAGFAVGALPLTGFSTALGVGVMYLVNAICGKGGVEMGAAAAAAHMASAAISSQRSPGGR